MICEKYLEMTVEEIDGELEEPRSLLLMRHLVSCESCRTHYEKHLRLFCVMKEEISRDFVHVPENFSSSVMAEIDRDIAHAAQMPGYGASLISAIILRLKAISFAPASLYPLAALSVVFILAVAGLRDEKADSSGNPELPLANARSIKAESMGKKVLKAEANNDDLS